MLDEETRHYWITSQAVRSLGNGPSRKAARKAVEDLEMVGAYASSPRLFQGVVACLDAARQAANPAARRAATNALRELRVADTVRVNWSAL